jgi:hypothetical protein
MIVLKIWFWLSFIGFILLFFRSDRKMLFQIVFFKNGDIIGYVTLWLALIICLPITIPYSIKYIKK